MFHCALIFFFALFVRLGDSQTCVINTTYPNFLPWTIFPSSQHLQLQFPSPNDAPPLLFHGRTEIDFDVAVTTSCIVLRAVDMEFGTIELKSRRSVSISQTMDTLIVTLTGGSFIQGTTDTLIINFVAKVVELPANHYGLFRCANTADVIRSMLHEDHVIKTAEAWRTRKSLRNLHSGFTGLANENMFATQFEYYDARRAFPSFDEPAFKSYFSYNISVPDGFLALANTPMISSSTSNGVTTYIFSRTKIVMSTYLVAVAVGRFDVVQDVINNVRVFSPPGTEELGIYALREGVAYKNLFATKFQFPYENISDKMDLIAVSGFSYDAEENVGLLTFYPPMLLVSPNGSTYSKDLISQVVSHEISHQWCGDSYTAPNFNQLYMQEGTARFLQYIAVQEIHPEYNVFNQSSYGLAFGDTSYMAFTYLTALLADYQGISQPPVVLNLNEQAQGTTFYEKGAAINRQFMLAMGLPQFYKGIAHHVSRFFQKNPDYLDWVTSFSQVNNNPNLIQQWVPWLLQKSFPVIKVRRVDNNTVLLTQSPCAPTLKFVVWPMLNLQVEEFDGNLNLLSSYGVDFLGEVLTVNLKNSNANFVRINGNSTMFCISNYGNDYYSWNKLFQSIQTNEYAQKIILAELFVLAMTGHIDSQPLYTFLSSQSTSRDLYTVILQYFNSMLNRPLRYSPCNFPAAPTLFQGISEAVLEQVGWIGSSSMSSSRSIASFTAVYLRDNKAIGTAFQFFQSGQNIPADIQDAVFLSVAIRDASLLNTSDVLSLKALAQVATNNTICDFVGMKLQQNYPTNLGAISTVLSAAFQYGTCQPRGQLWDLVKNFNISNVFTGAFASTEAIQAISDLRFLSQFQRSNEIALVEQNILFCFRN